MEWVINNSDIPYTDSAVLSESGTSQQAAQVCHFDLLNLSRASLDTHKMSKEKARK